MPILYLNVSSVSPNEGNLVLHTKIKFNYYKNKGTKEHYAMEKSAQT